MPPTQPSAAAQFRSLEPFVRPPPSPPVALRASHLKPPAAFPRAVSKP
ncbi:hypothetical protein CGMCC3_g16780 [Colletotrichum fructicola]|nr:uncharacterized protein CGMCC3_g16780 [Colletotrichum fructicola]KAE9567087.1 hypothetical protein CGMCC3_g16780 [Colletotrichum fructicola]